MPRQLDEAEAWLVRDTCRAPSVQAWSAIDRAEYPRPALGRPCSTPWPTGTTASGATVSVFMPSRIVSRCIAPGGPGGPMRLDNLLTNGGVGTRRWCRGWSRWTSSRSWASGWTAWSRRWPRRGCPRRCFADTGDTFVVTLYGAAAQLRSSLTPHTGLDVPAAAPRPRRPERQAWALEHLRREGPLSPRAYAAALGVSVDTAVNDLRALVEQGLVRRKGRRRTGATCYGRSDRRRPAPGGPQARPRRGLHSAIRRTSRCHPRIIGEWSASSANGIAQKGSHHARSAPRPAVPALAGQRTAPAFRGADPRSRPSGAAHRVVRLAGTRVGPPCLRAARGYSRTYVDVLVNAYRNAALRRVGERSCAMCLCPLCPHVAPAQALA